MKYIKKPIPVEAVQWLKDGDHAAVVTCGCTTYTDPVTKNTTGQCCSDCGKRFIQTKEGRLHVEAGVWIVGPGAAGEYWPVQNKIFFDTYTPA